MRASKGVDNRNGVHGPDSGAAFVLCLLLSSQLEQSDCLLLLPSFLRLLSVLWVAVNATYPRLLETGHRPPLIKQPWNRNPDRYASAFPFHLGFDGFVLLLPVPAKPTTFLQNTTLLVSPFQLDQKQTLFFSHSNPTHQTPVQDARSLRAADPWADGGGCQNGVGRRRRQPQ